MKQKHPGGRPHKYPWDRWLNRPKTILLHGRDYECSDHGMVRGVYRHVRRRKIKCVVNCERGRITITRTNEK